MPRKKITDGELVFLKNLGFTIKEIAKIKDMHYQSVYQRARPLADQGYIVILPREYALSVRSKRRQAKLFRKIVDFLNSNGGVVSISKIYDTFGIKVSTLYRILREHDEELQLLHLKYFSGSRGSVLSASRLIKAEYLGKKFLATKTDRTALVRFFMEVFKEEKEYNQRDVSAITHWLKNFVLSRAERVAIVTSLGYEYSSLEHMRIGRLFDNQPRELRFPGGDGEEKPNK